MSDLYKGSINDNFTLILDTFLGSNNVLPDNSNASIEGDRYCYDYKLKFEDDKTFYYLKYMVRYCDRLTFTGVVLNKEPYLHFSESGIIELSRFIDAKPVTLTQQEKESNLKGLKKFYKDRQNYLDIFAPTDINNE